jgi:iron complex transport system ATP-binding protein
MTPLLQFVQTRFQYNDRQPVLRGIDFTLSEGTCSALIGANGAGKTTLLRLASGTLAATSGKVLLEGKPVGDMPHRQRSRVVALVPQRLDVPFDFSVQQIVEQGRTPYLGLLSGPAREDRFAVDRALELTDTARLRRRIFNELSGGERQRVKIALGLAQQAKLLLLDEPTQSLDIGRQAELIDLLHSLRSEGVTVLASIHDLHLVHGNFSTAHLIGPEGSLISGAPAAVLTPANLTRAFRCAPGRHPLLVQPNPIRQAI